MKLALIVFLGFCAITAQAYPSHDESARSDLGPVPISIFDFVSRLMAAIKGLNEKVQGLITSIKNIIKSVIYQGIQKASNAWAKVEAKLEEIKRKGDKPKACVEKYAPAMKEAKAKMDADIKQCTDDLTSEGEKVKKQLEDGVQTLIDTVKQFYSIVDECASFNPIKSAKCIRDHMSQFKEFIMNAIHSTEETITDIRNNITEAAKNGAVCTKNAVVEFGSKQKEITGLIQDCMQLSTPAPTVTSEPRTTPEVTQAPTVKTTAAEKTTKTEEKTTKAEEKTTKAEEKTTKVEEKTTKAAEKTTKAEEKTTKAEEKTTKAAEKTTDQAERTTQAPTVKTTESVENTTKLEEVKTTKAAEVTDEQ